MSRNKKELAVVVYHGTENKNVVFRRNGGAAGVGIYFTPNFDVAEDYAEMAASIDGDKPVVIKAKLTLKNPYITSDPRDFQAISPERRDELEARGYDGVLGKYPSGDTEYIAFDPKQITRIS